MLNKENYVNAVLKLETSGESIRQIALDCVESCPDWLTAAALMRSIIDSDPALYRKLAEPLIDGAIWTSIRHAARATRRDFQVPASGGTRRIEANDAEAMGRERLKDWLSYQLSGGTRLGDATREKILEDAQWHDTLAHVNAKKACLFKEIAARIGERRVRDVLDHEAIETIWSTISC